MTLPPAKLVADSLLETVLPACALALVCVPRVRWLAPLALVAGWAAGNHFRGVAPWLPDGRRIEWLPWLVAGAALLGTLSLWKAARGPAMVLYAAGLTFASLKLIPASYPPWAAPCFVALNAALGVGLLRLGERTPGFTVPAILCAALYAASGVCIHTHSARLMDAAMLGGVATFVVAVVAGVTRTDAGAVAPAAVMLLTGTLFIDYHETTSLVPPAAVLLVALAPFAAFVSSRRWRMLLPVALLLAAALALAAYYDPIDFADFENF